MTNERPTEPAAASGLPGQAKLPPFKRAAAATTLPSTDAGGASEAPATLLFNDVSDDAVACDPNDPDCELV